MDLKTSGDWPLPSGVWQVDDAGVWSLQRSADGQNVSPLLSHADIGKLMHARRLPAAAGAPVRHFPPEFAFDPATGTALQVPPDAAAPPPWVPPYGAYPVSDSPVSGPAGLRQASVALTLADQRTREEHAQADASLPMPPPGEYEFFNAQFGTSGAALLALDPRKAALHAWLPASKRWLALEPEYGGLLAESDIDHAAWRAELVPDFNSVLVLPTSHGLACIRPDVPSLTYVVEHVGGAPCVAAPIWFQNRVWAPLRDDDGHIRFVNLDAQQQPGSDVLLDGVPDLGAIGAPVAYNRMAVWPCAHGQLRLQLQPDGNVAASFTPWPAGLVPHFEFGSPYVSRDGGLWQLCFERGRGTYVYVKLGAQSEQADALAPRLCSGSFNYRFATKLKTAPWEEPEHGDDGGKNQAVMPLLESGEGNSVFGVKFATSAGLSSVLRSNERLAAQLVQDDTLRETVFHTFAVSEPWRVRLFVSEGMLWAYHPLLSRIDGWTLQA
ncbi:MULTISPECIES: hypothetical protein [unclassified Janthinobacterium]|uniref:hypothetical protein n=1 Tax=unclassified Janthinobacterium TaxID=2610881 RepID=UPI00088681DC|nr:MULTISPECIES: hypothetical protein [unclassified Janthinobacterium]SDA83230.1 hypothetical protein SAMN03159349_05101 [Janthinobacterium sp. 551a]SFB10519.1 hypothetical protein SAMN03159300_10299 [Janthinobacterium sp. 344]